MEVLKATKEAAMTGRDLATEHSKRYTSTLTAPLRNSQASKEGVTAFAQRRKANYTDP
jgi:enoyl-CoA hydratase/carnithine racemase